MLLSTFFRLLKHSVQSTEGGWCVDIRGRNGGWGGMDEENSEGVMGRKGNGARRGVAKAHFAVV
jgi:hypothetical protein